MGKPGVPWGYNELLDMPEEELFGYLDRMEKILRQSSGK